MLLADYSRRGFMDGIGIRLPTICIRPGLPNKAASGFFSNILREPLAGKEAVLPVSEDVRHWHATPRSAVGFLLHAATMDAAAVGARRNLTMPGLSATVGEQIAALKRVAGDKVAARIKREPDPFIMGIVDGWPRNFDAETGAQLGFTTAEKTFDDIIRIHIEDELGGKFVDLTLSRMRSMTKVACIGECMIELKQADGGLYSRGYGGDTLEHGGLSRPSRR